MIPATDPAFAMATETALETTPPTARAGEPRVPVDGASEPFDKPYKGLESFQVEDRDLFHGRDAEAEHLIARILSSRFTLLHAQSGAGKTSLLNARVIPGMESRGWFPVRILLQNDPLLATRMSTLQYLLPPPESEVMVIRRACRLLELDENTACVSDVLDAYDALEDRDKRKRAIIAPVQSDELARAYPQTGAGRVTPYACRVIRGSLDLTTAAEQWNVVLALAARGGELPQPLAERLPLRDLIPALEAPAFRSAYQSLVSFLDPPGRCSAAYFFTNLLQVYGRRFSRFGLVLLFDQFEELFTRFVDVGPVSASAAKELPDWRLRHVFFSELQELYVKELAAEDPNAPATYLPIRVVLSMRSEYIGKLDAIRAFVQTIEQCTYHLQLPRIAEASKAIREPAKAFGYTYDDQCYARIIRDLQKEEAFVEPAHLQVVCEHLWNAKGRELAEVEVATGGRLPSIPLAVYEQGDGLKGIMKTFLWGYLQGLDARDQLECIDIFEQLLTPSGTRNIIERDYLVGAPFRNRERRARLLGQLVDRTIVRAETRLGGQFIEVTHEFLIDPIKEAIQRVLAESPDHKPFTLALDALERVRDTGNLKGTDASLMEWEFEVLDRHAGEIEWLAWGSETMLRNAILWEAAPEVLERWMSQLESACNHG